MASFVIHTIVGEEFFKKLEKEYKVTLSNSKRKMFLLGNLIVDSLKTDKTIPSNLTEEEEKEYKISLKTKIRAEKITTHFRNPEKEELCLKIPEPELFIKKYPDIIKKDFTALGYLFHLYTDKIFFSKLFPITFETLDINKQTTNSEKEAKYIRIFKSNTIIDNKEFWASTTDINIYNDYTIMNSLLLKKYGTSFNKDELTIFANNYFKNPGIKEVDYEKIHELLNLTESYIKESFLIKENKELKVFEKQDIIDFINNVPNDFLKEYQNLIKNVLN